MSTEQSRQSESTGDPAPGLWGRIKEDWVANGRDWTLPGFRAVAVYRFGVWRMGVRFAPLRMVYSFIYRRLFRYVRNHYGIELYYTANIGRRLQIGHQGAIVIHDHCTIGDDCVIRQGVTIGAARLGPGRDAPRIGNRVSLGAGAMIIGSVTIGDDAMIGPNAVVMMNVPEGATATAMPARVIPPAAKPKTESSAEDSARGAGDAGSADRAGSADNAGGAQQQPKTEAEVQASATPGRSANS